MLALSAALWALGVRVTLHFSATFNQKGAPGQQAPLVADAGFFASSGPGFSVVPTSVDGGALYIEGTGQSAESTLTGTFVKSFKGTDLLIGFTASVASAGQGFALRAIEDSDGEIIDVGWDGNGFVDIDGQPAGSYTANQPASYALTVRDAAFGADLWILTITPENGVPVTTSGSLHLPSPFTAKSIKFVIPAGVVGSMLVDDLNVTSISYGSTNK
ncbi:MAG: hypothetical protein FJ296_02935 [Planctomycetes bacterium]|nr:hypothetical protein [Planctomycetota bacterium]